MDSSLQSANLATDEVNVLSTNHEETGSEEEEHHIHLPNPSIWPLILSAAILMVIVGLLFLPDAPWLAVVGAPIVLVGILGWALEDPMAAPKGGFIDLAADKEYIRTGLRIGQDVVDSEGQWLGTVQARLAHYALVERGGLLVKTLYVPYSDVKDVVKGDLVRLATSEGELLARGLNGVPDDLNGQQPEFTVPKVTGTPLFARGPLSPAQTGHYNYGPNYPGINTDASGSYRRDDVSPAPQKFVGERNKRRVASRISPPQHSVSLN
ncbi:hypothetical protein EPA93_17905 [Ktedonosporobacter rubrisoli]|uniref:Cytochrome aa3 subunit 4 n=1 Tax=Ktedonosporobacter rubrisoli TaxID=2509675 RepID=A0A4P6JSE0_KTERU|nr:hypothetical protein [Ktedonosporobacter rubrisoli]QBD77766.1 hypothetical protein EPA93_17905 [Ktedonosporobacter rubrisoli]